MAVVGRHADRPPATARPCALTSLVIGSVGRVVTAALIVAAVVAVPSAAA
jgi:hypothetical protein